MDPNPTSRAASGLTSYVRTVAKGLRKDVLAIDCDTAEAPATALILVRSHLPTLPDRTLLLAWDEVNGWALRVKIDADGDTVPISYFGNEVLPEPAEVKDFYDAAVAGHHPGIVFPPWFRSPWDSDDLEHRLARFA